MRANVAAKSHRMTSVHEAEAECLLTGREKRVLLLVAKAQSNKEIAASLNISPSTVKRHLENILRKLGLRNRVEAAIYALKNGGCPLGKEFSRCPILIQQVHGRTRPSDWAIWPIDSEKENVLGVQE